MNRLLVVLTLCGLACGSPQKDARDAAKSFASWASTGALLSREWGRGAVPSGYATSTAEAAIQSLRRTKGMDRATLERQATLWRELERAARSEDRSAAARLAAGFHALAATGPGRNGG